MEPHSMRLKWTCQSQTPFSKIKRSFGGPCWELKGERRKEKEAKTETALLPREHFHISSLLQFVSVFNFLYIFLLCSLSWGVWHDLSNLFLSTMRLVIDLWPEAALRWVAALHGSNVTWGGGRSETSGWSRFGWWSATKPQAAARPLVWTTSRAPY